MIEHLIVDSGGFVRNCPIDTLAKNAYTVPGVVKEIRDKATRQRLKVLPYELKFRDPTPTSLAAVSAAAKESGDFSSLSAVDLQVLALTYELTRETDPDKEIRESLKDLTVKVIVGKDEDAELSANKIPGFYEDDREEEEEEVEGDEEGEESDYDDSDWITPENIKEIDEGDAIEEEKADHVACLTIDFAMQNVLLKMNLGRVGLEGRKINQIRKWILRCAGCYYQDKTASKVFCPACGHKTMKRVACEVLPDGSLKLFLAKNPKCLSSRGTKYTLPAVKGGKYAKNMVLTDMQPMPQQKVSRKAMMRENPSAADFEAWGNPFAVNDVESKSFRLGYGMGGGQGKFKNANAARSKGKRRK